MVLTSWICEHNECHKHVSGPIKEFKMVENIVYPELSINKGVCIPCENSNTTRHSLRSYEEKVLDCYSGMMKFVFTSCHYLSIAVWSCMQNKLLSKISLFNMFCLSNPSFEKLQSSLIPKTNKEAAVPH